MMSVVMVAAQNSSRVGEMGMTTSSVNLMRSIGATAGTAIFSMLITQRISSELMTNSPPGMYDTIPHGTGVLDVLSTIKDSFGQVGYDAILTSFANSVNFAFLIGGIIMFLLVFVGLFIRSGNRKIKEKHDHKEPVAHDE